MNEMNVGELMILKVNSNNLIKKYRATLNLETPSNRVDQGDLKCIFAALDGLGFSVVKQGK